MTRIRLRMFAPVVFLATGACFATTKDVVQLQADVRNSRSQLEQQIRLAQQQQAARDDSLKRMLVAVVDSLRSFEARFFATGGNIADNTSGLQRVLNQMVAKFDALLVEQENSNKELKLLGEQVRGINAALAADSARTDPVEGPLARLNAGERQITRSPSAAREIFDSVIATNPDSAILAKAYFLVAHSYKNQDQRPQADSVFRIVFEKFPNSEEAPEAMYLVALVLENDKKLPEALALYQRVVEKYPRYVRVSLAEAGVRRIKP